MTAEGGDDSKRSEAVKVSMLSELGVLSGVCAGLASLFQAAAVERRLLRDVSQRVRTDQVPERERDKEEMRGSDKHHL